MNRVKNPYCLDPKETSCPRLKKLGMEWDPVSGSLKRTTAPPARPTLPEGIAVAHEDLQLIKELGSGRNPNAKKSLDMLFRYYKRMSPTYLDEIPPEVSKLAAAIERPYQFERENEGWQVVANFMDELGVNAIANESEKKLYINFRGFSKDHEFENVKNIFMGRDNKIQYSEDFTKNRAFLNDILGEYEGFDVQFNGHSYGGYKARYFASLFDEKSVLLNSHHMPWSRFPDGGKHIAYTVVTDPLDFKHLFGVTKKNETHFYVPSNEYNASEGMEKLVDGHYLTQFDALERKNTFLASYHEHIGVLGTIAGGLGVGMSIYDITQNRDPTNTMALTTSTFDPAGLILDSEYQYDDENPPTFGIDWGIYTALQPFKSTILSGTPWGKKRAAQNEEIAFHEKVLAGLAEQNNQNTYTPPSQPFEPETFTMGGKTYVEVPPPGPPQPTLPPPPTLESSPTAGFEPLRLRGRGG